MAFQFYPDPVIYELLYSSLYDPNAITYYLNDPYVSPKAEKMLPKIFEQEIKKSTALDVFKEAVNIGALYIIKYLARQFPSDMYLTKRDVRDLIEKNKYQFYILTKDDLKNYDALYYAVENNNMLTVRHLIENVGVIGTSYDIHLALSIGNKDMIKYLYKHGCPLNPDKHYLCNLTSMQFAVENKLPLFTEKSELKYNDPFYEIEEHGSDNDTIAQLRYLFQLHPELLKNIYKYLKECDSKIFMFLLSYVNKTELAKRPKLLNHAAERGRVNIVGKLVNMGLEMTLPVLKILSNNANAKTIEYWRKKLNIPIKSLLPELLLPSDVYWKNEHIGKLKYYAPLIENFDEIVEKYKLIPRFLDKHQFDAAIYLMEKFPSLRKYNRETCHIEWMWECECEGQTSNKHYIDFALGLMKKYKNILPTSGLIEKYSKLSKKEIKDCDTFELENDLASISY